MSTAIVATTRRPRGGRTVGKATIDEVMDLSRNLPLTRSVLKATLQDATRPASLACSPACSRPKMRVGSSHGVCDCSNTRSSPGQGARWIRLEHDRLPAGTGAGMTC